MGVISTSAQTAMPSDLLRLSQYNYSFGTARSAALGGAFTSLGGDLSSMTINPAGLGMYRSSEVGITPSITSSSLQSNYEGVQSSDSRSKFSLGNFAGAFNLYNGGGALTSFTLGFGYNKLSDFNTASYAHTGARNTFGTINRIFAEAMNGVDVQTFSGSNPYNAFNNLNLSQWGGALAYQTGILNPINQNQYSPFQADPSDPAKYPAVLGEGASVNPALRNLTQGNVGEYAISAGMNFGNIVYFGATVGIQDVYYNNESIYSESYNNNTETLKEMTYIRRQRFDGTGVNGKFGIIVRPTNNFRIGLSVHTPTYISVTENNQQFMSAVYSGKTPGGLVDTPLAVNEYTITTPTRLLAGLSYTLPGVGLITADYERVWYNGMRLGETNSWPTEQELKEAVKKSYKAANNFRVGVEGTISKNAYVRAGYALYGDCMKESDMISPNQADVKSYENYSGGLGYRFGRMSLDLAYVYTNYKYLQQDIFYFQDGDYIVDSGLIQPKQTRHTVLLSFSTRF